MVFFLVETRCWSFPWGLRSSTWTPRNWWSREAPGAQAHRGRFWHGKRQAVTFLEPWPNSPLALDPVWSSLLWFNGLRGLWSILTQYSSLICPLETIQKYTRNGTGQLFKCSKFSTDHLSQRISIWLNLFALWTRSFTKLNFTNWTEWTSHLGYKRVI